MYYLFVFFGLPYGAALYPRRIYDARYKKEEEIITEKIFISSSSFLQTFRCSAPGTKSSFILLLQMFRCSAPGIQHESALGNTDRGFLIQGKNSR
jgi:hypothetical protein